MNNITANLKGLFERPLRMVNGVYVAAMPGASENELHTAEVFSHKWVTTDQQVADEEEGWKKSQFQGYLRSYGFGTEGELVEFLADRRTIIDAEAALGYKAAGRAPKPERDRGGDGPFRRHLCRRRGAAPATRARSS